MWAAARALAGSSPLVQPHQQLGQSRKRAAPSTFKSKCPKATCFALLPAPAAAKRTSAVVPIFAPTTKAMAAGRANFPLPTSPMRKPTRRVLPAEALQILCLPKLLPDSCGKRLETFQGRPACQKLRLAFDEFHACKENSQPQQHQAKGARGSLKCRSFFPLSPTDRKTSTLPSSHRRKPAAARAELGVGKLAKSAVKVVPTFAPRAAAKPAAVGIPPLSANPRSSAKKRWSCADTQCRAGKP